MTIPVNLTKFKEKDLQRRLFLFAGIFIFLIGITLSLSPAARNRSWATDYRWDHWLAVAVWGIVFYYCYTHLKIRNIKNDPFLLPIAALLSGWGILSIWRLAPNFGLRQSIWLIISGVIFIMGLRLPNDLGFLRKYKYLWLFGGLTLTFSTLLFGINPLGLGPKLWLGCCGVYLQPSEPLKLLLIIFLAAYLADRQPITPGIFSLLLPTGIMVGITISLLLIQRDLGTASVFLFIYTSVIFVATGKRKVLLFTVLALLIAGIAGYLLYDLIQIRVDAWFNPWLDPSGRSYQIVQALIAVSSGGLIGRGPGMGSPGLVPIAHSDFIFSTISEETGLAGTIALFLILAIFTLRGLKIGLGAENRFHRYLAIGLTTYIASQSILIIGGNIRMLPLTGVPLPFVSYGGSSLVTSFIALLLLTKISAMGKKEKIEKLDIEPVKILSAIFITGFLSLALINGWWAFVRGPDLLTRTDNVRRTITDRFVLRGSILDRDDTPLNMTIGESGDYQRIYLQPGLNSVLGYTHPLYGQSGAEASLDDYLRGLEGNSNLDIWRDNLLYGQTPPGVDIRISIDSNIQTQAESLLKDHSGAIVVINSSNGQILSMVSSPGYDPNTLDEDLEAFQSDESGRLINRAIQGLYQPGPILGPLLLPEIEYFDHSISFPDDLSFGMDGIKINCIELPRILALEALAASGCPLNMVNYEMEISEEVLISVFTKFGFFESPAIRLDSDFLLSMDTVPDMQLEIIGQGELQISPLHLAIAYSTINNNGIYASPHFLLEMKDEKKGWTDLQPLGEEQIVFTLFQTNEILDSLRHSSYPIWQAISYGFNGPEQPLTWYVGGTMPGMDESIVVVVLLEHEDAILAEVIGQNLLSNFYSDQP